MTLRNLILALSIGSACGQIPDIISRPAIENRFTPTTSDLSGESIQGAFFVDPNNPSVPKGEGLHLTESSFGQAFANYVTPYSTYTNEVLSDIFSNLYPSETTRSAIQNGNAPFRYKYLLYGTDGDSIAILDLFEASNDPGQWFGQPERDAVRGELAKLREAIAQDPLNPEFQDALLEIYYDWAVGESQLSKQLLSKLARIRLGLISSQDSPFIIDFEIETYETLVENAERILDVYKDLLTEPIDGINPSDFDPTAGNAPFGYYIFKNRVPRRYQAPSQVAWDTDIVDVLPVDPGQFSGYKDYRTLLTFLGQYIEYQAELARLRGIRKASGDLTKARDALTEIQNQAGLSTLLANMFTDREGNLIDFDDPAFDESGIRGARYYVESALAEAANTRSYLDGNSNHLGIDPNFLMIIPTDGANDNRQNQVDQSTGVFDTYDILQDRLTRRINGNPVAPLAIAQDAYDEAVVAFDSFRAIVDNIGNQLDGIETDFNDDFERLTGYGPGFQQDFDGVNPNPAASDSDLASANRRISDLSRRNLDIIAINRQIMFEIAEAQEAVTLAQGISGRITGAQTTYLNDTADAWTEIHVWAGAAAASAGLYQTLDDVVGIDLELQALSGGAVGGAVAAAGALNAAIQTAAAVRTSQRQQEIEEAAIALEVAIALAPLELEVKQAQMVVNTLNRDLLSNLLEIKDNNAALAQAVAERTAILREIQILQRNLQSDSASLANSYFADPIFFIRAEREILRADPTFRNAQRWMFYTCRALEYKWQQRFVWEEGGNSFDIGSILTARNYVELEEIRQHMASADNQRCPGAGPPQTNISVISLRDLFITPNPNDLDRTYSEVDDGERYSASQGRMVDKVEHFREILKRDHIDDNGNLTITFNTSILRSFGSFFRGPSFGGTVQDPGNYRNKIVWTAFHLLKDPELGDVDVFTSLKNGAVKYGGQTYFRTRVPVDPATREEASTEFESELDFPGAYVTSPVRYFQDTNLNGQHDLFDSVIDGIQFAESSTSAIFAASTTRSAIVNSNNGIRSGDLKERAVAASRITLEIFGSDRATTEAFIDELDDIEFIVQHQSYPRARIDN